MITSARLTPILRVAPGADAPLAGVRRVHAQRERARTALDMAFACAGAAVGPLPTDAGGMPLPIHGWHWSLSHTRDCAAAVVATDPVGIDVEPIALHRAAEFPNVVSPAERSVLGDIDALLFARLWTAKEALLKRAGVGLAELSDCRVVGVCGAHAMRLSHRGGEHFVQQATKRGFVVSLAAGLGPEASIAWTWSS